MILVNIKWPEEARTKVLFDQIYEEDIKKYSVFKEDIAIKKVLYNKYGFEPVGFTVDKRPLNYLNSNFYELCPREIDNLLEKGETVLINTGTNATGFSSVFYYKLDNGLLLRQCQKSKDRFILNGEISYSIENLTGKEINLFYQSVPIALPEDRVSYPAEYLVASEILSGYLK